MASPTYSVRTWDYEKQTFTPDARFWQSKGLTLWQLKDMLKVLKSAGYSCHRFKHGDSDPSVLVEREDAND